MKQSKKAATRSPAFYILYFIFLMLLIFLTIYFQNQDITEALLTAVTVAAAFFVGIPFTVLIH